MSFTVLMAIVTAIYIGGFAIAYVTQAKKFIDEGKFDRATSLKCIDFASMWFVWGIVWLCQASHTACMKGAMWVANTKKKDEPF